MRYFTAALATVATALWFGGLVTLALLAMAVFLGSGLDRETAGRATSAMFVWFGRAQLAVGALALVAAFLGYIYHRGRITVLLFALLAVAAVGAMLFNAVYVPRLETLRIAGQTQSPEFHTLHKQSERLMTGVMGVLLAAAVALPAFCRALFAAPAKATDSTAD